MTIDQLVHVAREALLLALLVAAPVLVTAWLVGVLIGVAQAATQVQEPVVGLVPRIVAVALVLLVMSPWIGAQVARFGGAVMAAIGTV